MVLGRNSQGELTQEEALTTFTLFDAYRIFSAHA